MMVLEFSNFKKNSTKKNLIPIMKQQIMILKFVRKKVMKKSLKLLQAKSQNITDSVDYKISNIHNCRNEILVMNAI